jgi:hydroxypyruvate reductase
LLTRALASPDVSGALADAASVHVVAAGKAAGVMLDTFMRAVPREVRVAVGIGPRDAPSTVSGVEWLDGGHPVPTEGSLRGAERALAIARATAPNDLLLVLLSGGGSALMAMPVEGVTLADKQATVRTLLAEGADIYELNTVRKHLSAVKGGLLAAAAPGRTLTLVVSDVVGDDLSFIASGPTVPDESTYGQALDVLIRRGGVAAFPSGVVGRLENGVLGLVPETPAAGDPRLARASAIVIGRQRGALEDAGRVARELGYRVIVVPEPVTGEAREAAVSHVQRVAALVAGSERPTCVLSSGETTVTVRGRGRGGRNQEFACAAAPHLGVIGPAVALGSLGTDGIDGPTDAAGAVADSSTLERAAVRGLPDPETFLRENDSYSFFDALGDLIRTGPTRTNVGDVQVTLIG